MYPQEQRLRSSVPEARVFHPFAWSVAPVAGNSNSSWVRKWVLLKPKKAMELALHLISDWATAAALDHVESLTQYAERRDGDGDTDDGFTQARHTPAGIADAASVEWWPGTESNCRHADSQSSKICTQKHPGAPQTTY